MASKDRQQRRYRYNFRLAPGLLRYFLWLFLWLYLWLYLWHLEPSPVSTTCYGSMSLMFESAFCRPKKYHFTFIVFYKTGLFYESVTDLSFIS